MTIVVVDKWNRFMEWIYGMDLWNRFTKQDGGGQIHNSRVFSILLNHES